MLKLPGNPRHYWRFFRAGGFDQVSLATGADLAALGELDLKLWVALACPATDLEFDPASLAAVDLDRDGRIRAPELIAAVQWAASLLRSPDELVTGADKLPLAAITTDTPEGKALASLATDVPGRADPAAITVAEAAAAVQSLAVRPFNGDGVVPEESAPDDRTRELIRMVIAGAGGRPDASGKTGIDQAGVERFFAAAQAFSEWWRRAEEDAAVLPLGAGTAAAEAAVDAVESKVGDYFTRCRLAAFDPRAGALLNGEEKDLLTLAATELTLDSAALARLPLARVAAGAPLPLGAEVNPAWAARVTALRDLAVVPLLGERAGLTEADWAALTARLTPYRAWTTAKAGAAVEPLGLPRVRELLGGDARPAMEALIARDRKDEGEAALVAALHRLTLLHRDLARLCRNFVSFEDFFRGQQKAIFQAGTLYLDQRSCDLCLPVDDAARHAALAGLAGACLAYCDCVRRGGAEKRQIVAVLTGGDSDHLMAGRNGLFIDRQGRDWDATVTRIIDNPISVRQAFFAPYKKLTRVIEEQVAKRATAAGAAVETRLGGAADGLVEGRLPVPAPAGAPKTKVDTGTLAAIGLVLTTLLAAVGGIAAKLAGLPWWQVGVAFVALLLAISAPSMVMAALKLRRRSLGPILDANGWALNGRARINIPFGGSLTQVAVLPTGSLHDITDPFADRKSAWPYLVALVVLLAGGYLALDRLGFVFEWTGGRLGTPHAELPVNPSPAELPVIKLGESGSTNPPPRR